MDTLREPPPRSNEAAAALRNLATAPVHVVVNAASGSDDVDRVGAILAAVLERSGRRHAFHVIEPGMAVDDVVARVFDVATREDGLVVAVGGDGTLSAAAHAAHARGRPLAVVPQGTFNYFGRAHGVALDAAGAMEDALRGAVEPVQVATANGRVFVVNASVGLYPELLEDREAWKTRFGRSRAVALVAGLATLLSSWRRTLRLSLTLDGVVRHARTLTLFAGNNALQIERLGLPMARHVERGRLGVIVLKPVGAWRMVALALRGALGSLGDDDAVDTFALRELEVRPTRWRMGRPLKVALDGEVRWMQPPLRIAVAEQPLWLVTTRLTLPSDKAAAPRAGAELADDTTLRPAGGGPAPA